jgi:hypothetical protein
MRTDPIEQWHQIVLNQDPGRLSDLLADDEAVELTQRHVATMLQAE